MMFQNWAKMKGTFMFCIKKSGSKFFFLTLALHCFLNQERAFLHNFCLFSGFSKKFLSYKFLKKNYLRPMEFYKIVKADKNI